MSELFIGLITGTSVDAIDAALVDFSEHPPLLIDTCAASLPTPLQQDIRLLQQPGRDDLDRLGHTDNALGAALADAVHQLLALSGTDAASVQAIGSHGQTVRHRPHGERPFTLQIGDPNILAHRIGRPVVADFRRRDMAAGGQGAPFAPAFHRFAFHQEGQHRAILNLGGIANVTHLPANGQDNVTGFDSGPANTLLDHWYRAEHGGRGFDRNGEWAASGQLDLTLLARLLDEPYFGTAPPKSTGPEDFSPAWLAEKLGGTARQPADVQRTLLELTAETAARACAAADAIYLCGGGAHNGLLRERIAAVSGVPVETTEALGIGPDWVEAACFAWLARERIAERTVPLKTITGATSNQRCGAMY